MKNLDEKLKELPDEPGVYIMKDEMNNIIYVGKAKSLKKRVRQYFGSYGSSTVKLKAMVSNINDFEYIIVKNEIESLILESNLIKENFPKYNILLKDDKQYPYIKITMNEKYPRILKTRKILKDNSKYFGPYPASLAVNDAISVFERIFPIKTTPLNLNWHYGEFRPLNKKMDEYKDESGIMKKEEYDKIINKIIRFLSRKDNSIIEELKNDMIESSKNLEYEKAARIRNEINSLEILNQKQIITNVSANDHQDVIAIAKGVEEVVVQIFFIRNGKIIGREHYLLKDYLNEDTSEIISAFIKQFYEGIDFIPRRILVETLPTDKDILAKWLQDKKKAKIEITEPIKGEKRELIRLAKRNAIDMINKYSKKIENDNSALKGIQNILNLKKFPKRIEAYDISNISGAESVGAMVVFEMGEAKKSSYKKFKIKTINGPNDYGAMEEILTRRFAKINDENSSFSILPDLIMMDGGKGQVNIALNILKKFNLENKIAVCGLVKDNTHTTRGIIYNNKEYSLNLNSKEYRLVYKIQEEVHRFAITYHKTLRNKSMIKSTLDEIELVGPQRKKELMKYFKSINKIKEASIEDLMKVNLINSSVAKNIYEYFNGEENE